MSSLETAFSLKVINVKEVGYNNNKTRSGTHIKFNNVPLNYTYNVNQPIMYLLYFYIKYLLMYVFLVTKK